MAYKRNWDPAKLFPPRLPTHLVLACSALQHVAASRLRMPLLRPACGILGFLGNGCVGRHTGLDACGEAIPMSDAPMVEDGPVASHAQEGHPPISTGNRPTSFPNVLAGISLRLELGPCSVASKDT